MNHRLASMLLLAAAALLLLGGCSRGSPASPAPGARVVGRAVGFTLNHPFRIDPRTVATIAAPAPADPTVQ